MIIPAVTTRSLGIWWIEDGVIEGGCFDGFYFVYIACEGAERELEMIVAGDLAS